MFHILCPVCHSPLAASDYLECEAANTGHFAQCPECGACIPLPEAMTHEVPIEFEAA